MFSESIYIFLQTSISSEEFKKAGDSLLLFVQKFEILYGIENMVYNVHLLKHLQESVKNCGPLWAYSNFCFESNNGVLSSYVNGTTDVEKQIIWKYLLSMSLQTKKLDSIAVSIFRRDISAKKRLVKSKKIGSITLLGSCKRVALSEYENGLLKNIIVETGGAEIRSYRKLCINDQLFYSFLYQNKF